MIEPDQNPTGGSLVFLEHYRKGIFEGLKKGVPKQMSLNMIQALEAKPDKDSFELFERIYRAYGKHMDADP